MEIKVLQKKELELRINEFIEISHKNIDDEYWDANNFLADLTNKWKLSFYVVDEKKSVKAFVIASEKAETIHIHKFIVDETVQRQGLGKEMLNHLRAIINKPISLKVNDKNTKAIHFYMQNGFVSTGHLNGMYTMIAK
jgi:ribosomal protein S18 acetylase RimI-like enzyme